MREDRDHERRPDACRPLGNRPVMAAKPGDLALGRIVVESGIAHRRVGNAELRKGVLEEYAEAEAPARAQC